MEPLANEGQDRRPTAALSGPTVHTDTAPGMKRPIALAVGGALAAAACAENPPEPEVAAAESDWILPPVVLTAAVTGSTLTVAGQASPLGRVVLSAPGGRAFAAGADAEGRFRLVAPRPTTDTLFIVEAQVGQARYPAPYRLLVAGRADGPIALLSVGAPTVRLDPGPALDAVDSDGQGAILTGRAAAGAGVNVTAGVQRSVVVGANGRWSVSPPSLPDQVQVDGQAFEPSFASGGGDDRLTPAGAGWSLRWSTPGGARQSTWFPARSSSSRLGQTSTDTPAD